MPVSDFFNGVQNLNSNSFITILNHPSIAKFWFYFKVFAYFSVFIGICVAVYKFYFQYTVSLTVKSRIGTGGIEVKKDRAKSFVDKQGKRKLQLLKTRKGKVALTCPIPAGQFKGKDGKRDHYELWLDDNFQLHPVEHPVSRDGVKKKYLEIRPQDRDVWARNEEKLLREKYAKKDLLATYAPAGIMIMSMLIAFLIFFFGFKELGASMNTLASQIGQVASVCTIR